METSRRPWLLAIAPLVLLAHVAEEAPGLVSWMNRRLELGLTMDYFVAMSTIGLLITVLVTVSSILSQNNFLALGMIAWLSFLMAANAVLHLTASFLFREYVPGSVTAGILYLPYFFAASVSICRTFNVRARAAILAATLGAVPMLAQGISVLTAGRRILW